MSGTASPGTESPTVSKQETTTNTLRPCREESVDFDHTENLFIEGDNLQVLKVLQKSYYGRVKMIYIDPPYNTGKDFIYSDKFSRTKKEELIANGSIDEHGNVINHDLYRQNTRDSGYFHSNWLNMMYPRLFLAKTLLSSDGVLFVSIDDNEQKNLSRHTNPFFLATQNASSARLATRLLSKRASWTIRSRSVSAHSSSLCSRYVPMTE